MATSTLVPPTGRAHAVPSHPQLRRHRRDVVRWALAHGHRLDRDALAVLVSIRSDGAGRLSSRWTSDHVARVLWSDVPIWCSSHGVRLPGDVHSTLTTYLRYLSSHRRLEPGSDPIATLRRAVEDHRPGRNSARARHPAAGGAPAPVLPIS
jgi:hypothetical protein